MKIEGRQSILCNVESCKYNAEGEYCSLHAIQVAPCNNISNGKPEDESMCGSYEPR